MYLFSKSFFSFACRSRVFVELQLKRLALLLESSVTQDAREKDVRWAPALTCAE
jgi:hypothetical protein